MPTTAPSKRTSRGRQKIEIKKQENADHRRVTFTKRRMGLFEKAAELCILCGAKAVILTFSEGRKAFCFGNPETDTVLEAYMSRRSPGEIGPFDANLQALNQSKQLYLEASMELEREETKAKSAVRLASHEGFWWDTSLDDLELDELEYYHDALEKMMNIMVAKEGSNMEPGSGQGSLDFPAYNFASRL